jgi:hypothetical protein
VGLNILCTNDHLDINSPASITTDRASTITFKLCILFPIVIASDFITFKRLCCGRSYVIAREMHVFQLNSVGTSGKCDVKQDCDLFSISKREGFIIKIVSTLSVDLHVKVDNILNV